MMEARVFGSDLDSMLEAEDFRDSPERRQELMRRLNLPEELAVHAQRRDVARKYFEYVSPDDMVAYKKHFTRDLSAEKYDVDVEIPTEALTVMVKAAEKELFDDTRYLVASSGETLVVGLLTQGSKKDYFLQAQWGERLTPLETLVVAHATTTRKQQAKSEWKLRAGVILASLAGLELTITALTHWNWGLLIVFALMMAFILSQLDRLIGPDKRLRRLTKLDAVAFYMALCVSVGSLCYSVIEYDRHAHIRHHTDALVCSVTTDPSRNQSHPTLKGDFWAKGPQGTFVVQPGTVNGKSFNTSEGAAAALKVGESYRFTYTKMPIGDVYYIKEAVPLGRSLGTCSR
jgi:hypothetical protein